MIQNKIICLRFSPPQRQSFLKTFYCISKNQFLVRLAISITFCHRNYANFSNKLVPLQKLPFMAPCSLAKTHHERSGTSNLPHFWQPARRHQPYWISSSASRPSNMQTLAWFWAPKSRLPSPPPFGRNGTSAKCKQIRGRPKKQRSAPPNLPGSDFQKRRYWALLFGKKAN